MRLRKTWRTGLLVMLVAGLLTAFELKGAPRVTVQNPTALYLLAKYKLAVSEASSGVELLDRALAGPDSSVEHSDGVEISKACPAVAVP
jgi:hypothetical protein